MMIDKTTHNIDADLVIDGDLIITRKSNYTFPGSVCVTGNLTINPRSVVSFPDRLIVHGDVNANSKSIQFPDSVVVGENANLSGSGLSVLPFFLPFLPPYSIARAIYITHACYL